MTILQQDWASACFCVWVQQGSKNELRELHGSYEIQKKYMAGLAWLHLKKQRFSGGSHQFQAVSPFVRKLGSFNSMQRAPTFTSSNWAQIFEKSKCYRWCNGAMLMLTKRTLLLYLFILYIIDEWHLRVNTCQHKFWKCINNLTIDNDSITPQRAQPALHLYFCQCSSPKIQIDRLFFHFWNFNGYKFVVQASYHFQNPPFYILLILPLLATYGLFFHRHLGLRRTRAEAILALTPWEPKESKNLTKVASFLRRKLAGFIWMDGMRDGFFDMFVFFSYSLENKFHNFWLLTFFWTSTFLRRFSARILLNTA